MSAPIRLNVSGARSAAVTPAHGVTPAELRDLQHRAAQAHKTLLKARRSSAIGFYDLHKDKPMRASVKKTAKAFSGAPYENLVVLGIGGSALGTAALAGALLPRFHNLRSHEQRQGLPRLFIMDNVDPDSFNEMLTLCPPEKTLFNVISKSGGTSETVAQMLIVLKALEKAVGKSAVRDHLVVTTGPKQRNAKPTPLQFVTAHYKLTSFTVPPNVGGRFSVFTPVALFPAALLGIDIDALAAGCRAMDQRTSTATLAKNPAYLRAAIHVAGWETKSKAMTVMMPYSDRLECLADWYAQLWAESLGKAKNASGASLPRPTGQTPIPARGVTDQHSQLQLYLEGPNDKIITVLEDARFNKRVPIPDGPAKAAELKFLHGKTMNQLIAAERKATIDALRAAQRPAMRVTLPTVCAHTMGQLMYMLEVETAMAGQLLGIDPFDQPAVESIKNYTRRNLES